MCWAKAFNASFILRLETTPKGIVSEFENEPYVHNFDVSNGIIVAVGQDYWDMEKQMVSRESLRRIEFYKKRMVTDGFSWNEKRRNRNPFPTQCLHFGALEEWPCLTRKGCGERRIVGKSPGYS